MLHRRFLALVAMLAISGCSQTVKPAGPPVIVGAGQYDRTSAAWISLSRSGIVSDTVVTSGSITPGTDQSAAFQRVLDLAASGSITILVDVSFTCNTTPYIHSNTNLVGLNKSCGWMMGSNCFQVSLANYEVNALRAANSNSFFGVGSGINRTLGNFCSKNIGIHGLTINGNATNNVSGFVSSPNVGTSTQQPTGVGYPYQDFICGVRMWGVNGLVIDNVDLFDFPCFGGWFVNCDNVSIPSLLIDQQASGHLYATFGRDGITFAGPMGTVRGGKWVVRSNDDGVSLGSDGLFIVTGSTLNFGLGGPFYNFDLDTLILGINGAPSQFGVRLFTSVERLERVRIGSISGTTQYAWFFCDPDNGNSTNATGSGNVGTVEIGNVNVAITTFSSVLCLGACRIGSNVDYFSIDNLNVTQFPVASYPHVYLQPIYNGSGGNIATPTVKTFRIGGVNYLETGGTNAGNLITNVGSNVTHTVIGKGVVGRTGATGSSITALTINTGNTAVGHGLVDIDLITDGLANAVYLQSGQLSTLKSTGIMSNAGASNGWLNVASGQTVTNHLHAALGAVVPKSGAGTVTNDVGAGTFGG